ncbi:MAG: hypothetical protein ACO1OQ_09640 [Rufibacter sp.]
MKINVTAGLVFLGMIFSSFISLGDKSREEAFWEWFLQNEKIYFTLDGKNQGDAFDQLALQLHKIDENLTFEFGPVNAAGIKDFTISADGIVKSFPAVQKLVATAPKLANWQINAFRQRVPGDDLSIKLGHTVTLGYQDIYFSYAKKRGKINVELFIKDYVGEPNLINAIYLLLDSLLGEFDVETQIGEIIRKPLPEKDISSLHKFVELREIVDANKANKK